MPNELGTRDVVEQLDTRLGNLEQGQSGLRAEMVTRFAQVDSRLDQLRGEMTAGFRDLRGEMAAQMGELRGQITAGTAGLRGEITAATGGLREQMGAGWASFVAR